MNINPERQEFDRRSTDHQIQALEEKVEALASDVAEMKDILTQAYGAIKLLKLLALLVAMGAGAWTWISTNLALKTKAAAIFLSRWG